LPDPYWAGSGKTCPTVDTKCLHRSIDFWSRSCADTFLINIHIFPAQPFSIFIEQHPDWKGTMYTIPDDLTLRPTLT